MRLARDRVMFINKQYHFQGAELSPHYLVVCSQCQLGSVWRGVPWIHILSGGPPHPPWLMPLFVSGPETHKSLSSLIQCTQLTIYLSSYRFHSKKTLCSPPRPAKEASIDYIGRRFVVKHQNEVSFLRAHKSPRIMPQMSPAS